MQILIKKYLLKGNGHAINIIPTGYLIYRTSLTGKGQRWCYVPYLHSYLCYECGIILYHNMINVLGTSDVYIYIMWK